MLPLLYNLRNLTVRRLRTAATVLCIAAVVAVLCYLLCFADGLDAALAVSGDERNLIVLAQGATAETNSAVSHEQAERLTGLPGLATGSDGRPLVSPEVVVQTDVSRRLEPTGSYASVVVRGVDAEVALAVHPDVRLVEGRWFQSGTDELVVGSRAVERFAGTSPGSTLPCGEREFRIVGVFVARGGAHESECWGHVSNVAAAYRRERYSSATVRLTDARTSVDEIRERIAAAGIALRGVPEPEYYAEQAAAADVIRLLASVLAVLMGAGAVFAATNALHASVAARTRELGMLRAVGYSRRAVTLGVVAEALLLATAGGVLGCSACAVLLWAGDSTRDLVATGTFSSVAFVMRLTPASAALSMSAAVGIGLVGGLWPAWKAARVPLARALRMA